MATLLRSAKVWTWSFKMQLHFFEISRLPAPTLHPDILTLHDPADATDPRVYQLLCTMYLAMFPAHTEESESAVHDFAFLLFQDLGYAPIGRVFRTKKDINMVVCGEQRRVTADVCVLNDQRDILLLVQEDKGRGDPVPHLVAAAIAAFYSNNLIRRQTFGLPALASKTIPGITMKGTSPIFFKIPVTLELVAAVMGGQYPGTPTLIFPASPDLPSA
ncbi:hypothetical protein FB451DRAFT_1513271 [Mycena latifolia]|nr:hypothetical protein FB451DRAFT_1513271 [Mycena latifolia]